MPNAQKSENNVLSSYSNVIARKTSATDFRILQPTPYLKLPDLAFSLLFTLFQKMQKLKFLFCFCCTNDKSSKVFLMVRLHEAPSSTEDRFKLLQLTHSKKDILTSILEFFAFALKRKICLLMIFLQLTRGEAEARDMKVTHFIIWCGCTGKRLSLSFLVACY